MYIDLLDHHKKSFWGLSGPVLGFMGSFYQKLREFAISQS
jgi:hypothetical protein